MIQKWKKLKKNEKGLTLIELLAVLVILGIIAAIAIPLIGNVVNDSRDKAILVEASNIIAGAKLAQANGANPPFGPDDLKGYVDGVDLSNLDENDLEVSLGNNGWSIKYSRFSEIKSDSIKSKITNNVISESALKSLLK